MILYIWRYNETLSKFQKTAVMDSAHSVIWVTRYNAAGEFELYIPASNAMYKLFYDYQHDVLITRDDSDAVMIVDDILLTTDEENGDYLTITGQDGGGILGRRIIPKQTNFTGTAENCIRDLIDQNVINPTLAARKINSFQLAAAQGYTETIEKQVTGKNLLDTISEICASYDYGFRVTFDGTNFVFSLYRGIDRSSGQTTNPPVIFSPEYENIGNTSFTFGKSAFKTAVYVAGEGEGSNRKILNVQYSGARDLWRRELWVDARTTSSTTDGGELTPTEYTAVLSQQGHEELRNNLYTLDFNGEILNVNAYTYGVDYGLGDTVSVKNRYGISGTTTVSEITEVEDENGYRLIPTFSEWSV
jgi:hypothetical protein